ncbi:MAG: hypothetical protein R3353_03705 [Salegentibacter mishustinae]|nr:hypothetical protein [Salegentibacter mishustinae]
MKKIVLVMLSIGMLLSCSNDDEDNRLTESPNPIDSGLARAQKNGKDWQSHIYAIQRNETSDYFGIILSVYDGEGIRRQSLGFINLEKDTLTATVKRSSNTDDRLNAAIFATLAADGDVLCDVFEVYEPDSLTNTITITEFNEQTKEVSGTFNVTFIKDTERRPCDPDAPEFVRFTNGEFHTELINDEELEN